MGTNEPVSFTERIKKRFPKSPPGKASRHIHHFEKLVESIPCVKVIVYCRASARGAQQTNGNLADQKKLTHRDVEKIGGIVVGVVGRYESGWRLDDRGGRDEFARAVAMAKKMDAILVAESTSRFIRSNDYASTNQDAWPTEVEFEKLLALADGVILATILHPDASPRKERGFQTKRGQEAKGRRGGRPKKYKPGYKKICKQKLQQVVQRLHKQGLGYDRISSETRVPKSTLRGWLAK